jgi:hypothetical protein
MVSKKGMPATTATMTGYQEKDMRSVVTEENVFLLYSHDSLILLLLLSLSLSRLCLGPQ